MLLQAWSIWAFYEGEYKMFGTITNYESLTIVKGIAILLIVWGHFIPESSPHYWQLIHDILYTFHVPVFFFISGYLFGISKDKYRIEIGYLTLIKK